MAQDFWASSGLRLLDARAEGLVPTPAWLAAFAGREELEPPPGAGSGERAIHDAFRTRPLVAMAGGMLEAIEDPDARENWRALLHFRDRVLAHPTLEDCYRGLFRGDVDIAPAFVDALAQVIVRAALEGTEDAWLCRAAEMFYRRQRVSAEGGRVLVADARTLEVYAETGGFGSVGRLLRSQQALPEVKMDVLNAENAPLYFLRDELYGFVLDITPGGEGAAALARVLERWVARVAGAGVTIDPTGRVDDDRWRWHVGLDVDASAILDALYRGQRVDPAELERLLLLFRLHFDDPRDAAPAIGDRPVYLGLACRPDRTLRLKPQNLVNNLPLAGATALGG